MNSYRGTHKHTTQRKKKEERKKDGKRKTGYPHQTEGYAATAAAPIKQSKNRRHY